MSTNNYKNALKGHVALVTGASRGIGRGIALQLGEAGAVVYITGRQKSPEQEQQQSSAKYPTLEETANEVTARGGKGILVYCDHEDENQVEAVFEKIDKEQNGQLDILVNNAYAGLMTVLGVGKTKFWELPTSVYDTVNNTGLRNHYVCAVLAAKLMVPRRKGLIVTVSSLGGIGYLFNVAYGIGKAACDKLASDTAMELREFNITSVSLWPGPVKTELIQENVLNRVEKVKYKSAFAAGESSEFSGKCVAALASDPNNFELTGRILTTDSLGKKYNLKDVDGASVSHPSLEPFADIVENLNNFRAPLKI
ncbi:short chain dehydrogenase domain-containing protein [Ditylenchus destructor]|uniref:Short chain dehydrogenase domain-containing protein n=1 Tax=Ditylenchus destructor TaxID=166010 RepID=A0AAD4QZF0_9BILA|nr:short chain dehydrogenase domain-containing protein [Ditylenchus destructor]